MAENRDVYKLQTPIQFGSETITELAFRTPKAKDFRALPLEGITFGHIIDVMGRLCGQTAPVMDELQGADFQEVVGRFADFIGAGPKIGTAPSA